MNRRTALTIASLVIVGGVIVAAVVPSGALEAPPPIAAEVLAGRAVFTDPVTLKVKRSLGGGDTEVVKTKHPSGTVTARFTVQPDAQFPWHTHFGPVVVNVVQGTLVYVDGATCEEQTYSAGSAFVDLGHGDVHSAFNPGSGETVLVATFFEVPESGELLIPADAPEDCALPGS